MKTAAEWVQQFPWMDTCLAEGCIRRIQTDARADALCAVRALIADCSAELGHPRHGERGRGAEVALAALDHVVRELIAGGASEAETVAALALARKRLDAGG